MNASYTFPTHTYNEHDRLFCAAMWQCVEVCSVRVIKVNRNLDRPARRRKPFNKEGKTENPQKNLSEQT